MWNFILERQGRVALLTSASDFCESVTDDVITVHFWTLSSKQSAIAYFT